MLRTLALAGTAMMLAAGCSSAAQPAAVDQKNAAVGVLQGSLNYSCTEKSATVWTCTSARGGWVSVVSGNVNGHIFPEEVQVLKDGGVAVTNLGESKENTGQVVVGGF